MTQLQATGRLILAGGVGTHVLEAGRGSPLLLLHGGGPANSAELTWAASIPALARHFHVLAPDGLGFGDTEHPAAGDYSMAARIEHFAALVEAMDLRELVLVGHSQGGFIAMCLASFRLRERVRALVVVSSGTAAPQGNMRADGTFSPVVQETITYSDDPSFDKLLQLLSKWTYRPHLIDRAWLRRQYDRFIQRGNLEAYVRGTESALRGQESAYAGLHDNYIRPRLGSLPPCLLMWGREDDFAYPERGLALLSLIPRAEMHLLPACKHLLPWDQPEALRAAVLSFAARTLEIPFRPSRTVRTTGLRPSK